MEDYTLAAGYFGRFLERPPSRPQLANHRLFVEQVYDRLRHLNVKDLQYVQGVVQNLEKTYVLKPSWLTELYEDTLGLLLQVKTTESLTE